MGKKSGGARARPVIAWIVLLFGCVVFNPAVGADSRHAGLQQRLERVLTRIVDDRPAGADRDPGIGMALGVFYAHLGDFLHAQQYLQELRDARPGSNYAKFELRLQIAHLEYRLGEKKKALAAMAALERDLQQTRPAIRDDLAVQLLTIRAPLLGLAAVRPRLEKLDPFARCLASLAAAEWLFNQGQRRWAGELLRWCVVSLDEIKGEQQKLVRPMVVRLQAKMAIARAEGGDDALAEVRRLWQDGDRAKARAQFARRETELTGTKPSPALTLELMATAYLLDNTRVFDRARVAYQAPMPSSMAPAAVQEDLLYALVAWNAADRAEAYAEDIDDDKDRMAARVVLARILTFALPPGDLAKGSGLTGTLAYLRMKPETTRREIVLRDLATFREYVVPSSGGRGYGAVIEASERGGRLWDVVPGKRKLLATVDQRPLLIDIDSGEVSRMGALEDAVLGVVEARYSPDGRRLAVLGLSLPAEADPEAEVRPILYLAAADGSGLKRLLGVGRGAGSLTWSPDGKRLLFISDDKVLTAANVKFGWRAVYEEPKWTAFHLSGAVFDTDGKSLIFTKRSGDMDMTTYLMSARPEGEPRALYGQVMMQCSRLARSGDGKTLFLARAYRLRHSSGHVDILLYRPDSGTAVPIGGRDWQAWDPVFIARPLAELVAAKP